MKRIWRVTATVEDYVYAETEDEAIRIATDIPQRDLCMNSNNWDATPAVDRTGFVEVGEVVRPDWLVAP